MDLTDRVFQFLNRFNTPVSSRSFGVFRILFGFHILLIISQVFMYRELIFDAVPGVSRNVFPAQLFIFIWFVSALFLLAGLFTRFAALVNYACVVIATALFTASNVGTFNDDLLRIGSFLCIFMPVSKSFSFDYFKAQLTLAEPPAQQTSYLNYMLFLFLSLGLLYFPSALTKTYSPMWYRGLGLWIPCSIPHNKWNMLPNLIANQQVFMYVTNYMVILWELVFIFLLFIPRLHRYIVIPGLLFHTGIALLFPFPLICTGPLVFYTLFIPDPFWNRMMLRLKSAKQVQIGINSAHVTEVRVWRIIHALDYKGYFVKTDSPDPRNAFRKLTDSLDHYPVYRPFTFLLKNTMVSALIRNGYRMSLVTQPLSPSGNQVRYTFKQTILIYFVGMCVLLQGGISAYHVYSHYHNGAEKRMEYLRKRKAGYDLSMKPTNLSRTFLGINSRGLFLDHANTGQKTTYALTWFDTDGTERWLPMMTEQGYVRGELNMNMAWAKVNFNLIAFSTNPADSTGLKKLSRFWARRNHIPLDNLRMKVYKKTYTYPDHFEKDYFLKMEQLPWGTEGEILWKQGVFSYRPAGSDTIR